MNESKRNKLEKEKRALVLGAQDMSQAVAAARALKEEEEVDLARALETAIVVCFMRPFNGNLKLPDAYMEPEDEEDADFLKELRGLRSKVFAHTDPDGGRTISPLVFSVNGDQVIVGSQEEWTPLNRDHLDRMIAVFLRLRENMIIDAGKAQKILDGEIPLSRWGDT